MSLARSKKESAASTSTTRPFPKKALTTGYYWSTISENAKKIVTKCDKCHPFADVYIAPPIELTSFSSPWTFTWWGIDLLGPFPTTPGQVKCLIVVVDYFTKWIEAKPLENITRKNTMKFFKKFMSLSINGWSLYQSSLRSETPTRKGNGKLGWRITWCALGPPHYTTLVTEDSLFRHTYESEAVITVEIGNLLWRTSRPQSPESNWQAFW